MYLGGGPNRCTGLHRFEKAGSKSILTPRCAPPFSVPSETEPELAEGDGAVGISTRYAAWPSQVAFSLEVSAGVPHVGLVCGTREAAFARSGSLEFSLLI